MDIIFEKMLAKLLFWIYDFIDTIGSIFNILTGTQQVDENKRTLLQVFAESAISTKVLLGLCLISIIIAGVCVGVKTAKNVIKLRSGGESVSHSATIGQGFTAVISSVVSIFFVFFMIAFVSMLLNMVNDVIAPSPHTTVSQNLFDLSVEQSYEVDLTKWEVYDITVLDENNNPVQAKDKTSADGLAWETDAQGNYVLTENGQRVPIYEKTQKKYHPYKKDENGNYLLVSGWRNGYTAESIKWSMSPDEVFGVHEKDWLGLFEQSDEDYTKEAMVELDSFNFLTAYLVAVIMLISLFMLSVGLVKRIYDIVVLIFCMPLVCGTIPLDDGARFRAWRETFLSKLLVAFGAVLSINVFFMISRFISELNFEYLVEITGVLSDSAVTVFKMLLLLGGAMCINASQTLIARILGTSADESREAMQSFSMITSGVRVGAAGIIGTGRLAAGAGRMVFGGTNRYGRQRVGAVPHLFRGVNRIGERVGGDNYAQSRGAAVIRKFGRLGGYSAPYSRSGGSDGGKSDRNGLAQPGTINEPSASARNGVLDSSRAPSSAPYAVQSAPKQSTAQNSQAGSATSPAQPKNIQNVNNNVANSGKSEAPAARPLGGGLRTHSGERKSSFDNTKGKK